MELLRLGGAGGSKPLVADVVCGGGGGGGLSRGAAIPFLTGASRTSLSQSGSSVADGGGVGSAEVTAGGESGSLRNSCGGVGSDSVGSGGGRLESVSALVLLLSRICSTSRACSSERSGCCLR